MKKFFLICLVSFFALTSCQKYEKDDGVQWRTVKNRIKGNWILDQYSVSDEFKSKELISFNFSVGKKCELTNLSINPNEEKGYGDGYSGAFENDTPYLYIENGDGYLTFPHKKTLILETFNNVFLEFEIKSLTKDQLILQINNPLKNGVIEPSEERFYFKKDK